jgi:imidazolonepropionase-like amidohydrolase
VAVVPTACTACWRSTWRVWSNSVRAGPALRAATQSGADTCGLSDRGVLRAGLRADLVAVRGNPLDDIHALAAPVFVMQAGRVVHA